VTLQVALAANDVPHVEDEALVIRVEISDGIVQLGVMHAPLEHDSPIGQYAAVHRHNSVVAAVPHAGAVHAVVWLVPASIHFVPSIQV